MRITAIEPFVCDGGLREFGFLKVTTDEGIVGWADAGPAKLKRVALK